MALKPDGTKITAGVVLERDVLRLVDRMARDECRSRSYIINMLLLEALYANNRTDGEEVCINGQTIKL